MKKNIKFLLLFSLLILSNTIFSQQDSQFINYMFNQEVYNPAYGGTLDDPRINISTRSQWVGLDGAPKTNTLTFSYPLRSLAFGSTIINDKIGVNNQLYFSFNSSYKVQLNENTFFSLAINPSITNLSIKNSDLFVRDLSEEEFANDYTATKFNIGFGGFLFSDQFYIGYSIPRVFEQVIIDDNVSLNKNEFTQYLTGGYVARLSDDFKLKPAFLVKHNKNSKTQYDISASFLWKNTLNLGVNYKNNKTISGIIGLQKKSFMIAYSYDIENNDLVSGTKGSHELFIRYDILGKDKKLVTPRFF